MKMTSTIGDMFGNTSLTFFNPNQSTVTDVITTPTALNSSQSATAFSITDVTEANNTTSINTTIDWGATLTTDGKDFFRHLNIKDESFFVGLVVMGVLVPVLLITVFALICVRRRRERRERRAHMLLRQVHDVAMDDFSAYTQSKTLESLKL